MSQISYLKDAQGNPSSYGVTYTWVQGDDINDPVTIAKVTGVIDISSYWFWFTVKPNYGVPDSQAVFGPFGWQIGVGLGTSGQTAIRVTKVQTLAIPPGAYVFDFVMIDTAGNDATLMTSAGPPGPAGSGGGNANGSLIVLPRTTLTH